VLSPSWEHVRVDVATTPSLPLRLARVVTEVLSPAVIVVALPLAVAWQATGYDLVPTLGWGLLVAVFYSVIPMVIMVRGARRGRWDGHWVRERERRMVPFLLCLVPTAAGLAIMLIGGAPRAVIALSWSMITLLLAVLAITRWWKVSVHATVASGAAATVVLLYGPWYLLLLPGVALVCWSRVVVEDHTVAQVVVGALLGPVVGGVVFLALR
jgi:membrane-associated phospholipid phosphatase